MINEIFNILVSIFTICYSVHLIYYTYKEPSSWFSTNLKGYLAGALMIILSILSLAGKFNLFRTFADLIRRLFRIKEHQSGILVVLLVSILFLIVGLTYYRPDRIQAKYNTIEAENNYAKIKLASGFLLFYYAFTIVVAYLIVLLLKK